MYYVYILTNCHHTTFYTGMTDDVVRRNIEHQVKKYNGFTKQYNVTKLVYYEAYNNYNDAAHRERLIKKWKREYKINAINEMNPNWLDLVKILTEDIPTFYEEV